MARHRRCLIRPVAFPHRLSDGNKSIRWIDLSDGTPRAKASGRSSPRASVAFYPNVALGTTSELLRRTARDRRIVAVIFAVIADDKLSPLAGIDGARFPHAPIDLALAVGGLA